MPQAIVSLEHRPGCYQIQRRSLHIHPAVASIEGLVYPNKYIGSSSFNACRLALFPLAIVLYHFYDSLGSAFLHGEEVWRYVLYVCHYGWQWGRFRSCTGVDQQGFCKLDVNDHELAGQSLDMGSRCDETYGWELLLFLLSALYDSLRGQ